MSGRPGTGSIVSTVWPRSRKVSRRRSHCATASAVSTGVRRSIQGLIS
ncbi:Uncharacterised protein [Mycobacteroides abscessus]|nr:Uncharacterised protein [Mycobacteroides abscessus]